MYFAPVIEFAKGMGWHDINNVIRVLINSKNPFVTENLTKEQENELINDYKKQLLTNKDTSEYAEKWKYRIIRNLKEKDWTAFGDRYSSILNKFFAKYRYDGWIENEGWLGENKRENSKTLKKQIEDLRKSYDILK